MFTKVTFGVFASNADSSIVPVDSTCLVSVSKQERVEMSIQEELKRAVENMAKRERKKYSGSIKDISTIMCSSWGDVFQERISTLSGRHVKKSEIQKELLPLCPKEHEKKIKNCKLNFDYIVSKLTSPINQRVVKWQEMNKDPKKQQNRFQEIQKMQEKNLVEKEMVDFIWKVDRLNESTFEKFVEVLKNKFSWIEKKFNNDDLASIWNSAKKICVGIEITMMLEGDTSEKALKEFEDKMTSKWASQIAVDAKTVVEEIVESEIKAGELYHEKAQKEFMDEDDEDLKKIEEAIDQINLERASLKKFHGVVDRSHHLFKNLKKK